MIKAALTALLASLITAMPVSATANDQDLPSADQNLLTIVTSADPQTQLMSLILTRASQARGVQTRVLLCSAAGDLALAEPPETATEPLAPRGISPHGLLTVLLAEGVQIQVCAIYLPNSPYEQDDLLEGIDVATPPEIAAVMAAPQTRLFSF